MDSLSKRKTVLHLSLIPNNGEGKTSHSMQRNSLIYITFVSNYMNFLYNRMLQRIAIVTGLLDWEEATVALTQGYTSVKWLYGAIILCFYQTALEVIQENHEDKSYTSQHNLSLSATGSTLPLFIILSCHDLDFTIALSNRYLFSLSFPCSNVKIFIWYPISTKQTLPKLFVLQFHNESSTTHFDNQTSVNCWFPPSMGSNSKCSKT